MAGGVKKYVLNDSQIGTKSEQSGNGQLPNGWGNTFPNKGWKFLLDTTSKSAPRPTKPPIHQVLEVVSRGKGVCWNIILATYVQLVPRLRKCWDITPLITSNWYVASLSTAMTLPHL